MTPKALIQMIFQNFIICFIQQNEHIGLIKMYITTSTLSEIQTYLACFLQTEYSLG